MVVLLFLEWVEKIRSPNWKQYHPIQGRKQAKQPDIMIEWWRIQLEPQEINKTKGRDTTRPKQHTHTGGESRAKNQHPVPSPPPTPKMICLLGMFWPAMRAHPTWQRPGYTYDAITFFSHSSSIHSFPLLISSTQEKSNNTNLLQSPPCKDYRRLNEKHKCSITFIVLNLATLQQSVPPSPNYSIWILHP